MYQTIEKLPPYLRKYCVEQNQEKYAARDHAAWRYIMRQSRAYFKDHAVPIYLEGLKRTGMTLDRIPNIGDIDAKLRDLGWGAVPVEGFLPPAAFLAFQARGILPIASDMRAVDHIDYTPAPDIVHEAAGHAPILADPAYSEYLQMYAAMAQKAIFAREDLDLYEAIRALSDVKENPDCGPSEIQAAEAMLARATAALSVISEANKVARMNWWTVEYGLLGSLSNPKIYGAGLLSSVSESQACLSDSVRKLRLTAACVDTGYDITEPQPQLFVAEDISHLKAVLSEFEQTLSYRRGGVYGLEQARAGRTVTTTLLDSGVQIGGVVTEYLEIAGAVAFIRWQGPTQLCHQDQELAQQGIAQHSTGFSAPLGRAQGLSEKPLHAATPEDLERLGLRAGQRAVLQLTNGFQISGRIAAFLRVEASLIGIKWQDCTVTHAGKTYFQPDWGDFDMALGESVCGVSGGPADPERFGDHEVGTPTTRPGRSSPYSAEELSIFSLYQEVRDLRDRLTGGYDIGGSSDRVEQLAGKFQLLPAEWLLRLELVELARWTRTPTASTLAAALIADVLALDKQTQWLVNQGLLLSEVADS